jgi:hypothetical protein
VVVFNGRKALLQCRGSKAFAGAILGGASARRAPAGATINVGRHRDRPGRERAFADFLAVAFEVAPGPPVGLPGPLGQGFLGKVLRACDVFGKRFFYGSIFYRSVFCGSVFCGSVFCGSVFTRAGVFTCGYRISRLRRQAFGSRFTRVGGGLAGTRSVFTRGVVVGHRLG